MQTTTSHTTTSPTTTPLDATFLPVPLVLELAGQQVTGLARLNWGAAEVTLTSPVAHLTRRADRRGWSFAVMAHHNPGSRYTLDGAVTARGLEVATTLLTDLYLDWRAVSDHAEAVLAECRRARAALECGARARAALALPLSEARAALRRAFKAGALSQPEYQAALKPLSRQRAENAAGRWEVESSLDSELARRLEALCGRRISLAEAERLLADVPLVVGG